MGRLQSPDEPKNRDRLQRAINRNAIRREAAATAAAATAKTERLQRSINRIAIREAATAAAPTTEPTQPMPEVRSMKLHTVYVSIVNPVFVLH